MPGSLAALALGLIAVAAPVASRAAASTWAISLTPSTINALQLTTINATFWNLGGADGQQDLGCVRIAIPATFTVQTVAVTADPPGTTWHAAKSGLTTVTINTASGGDRLPPNDTSARVTDSDQGELAPAGDVHTGRPTPTDRRTARGRSTTRPA